MPSIIKDSTITLLARTVAFVLAMLTSIVISRVLGPSLKGSYNLLFLIISAVSLTIMLGLGSANVFYGARNRDDLPALTGNSVLAALGLGLLGILAIELATLLPSVQGLLLRNGVQVWWLRSLSLLLPLSLTNIYLVEIVRASGDIVRYNLVAIWDILTSFVGSIILLWLLDGGLPGAFAAWALSMVMVSALTVPFALKAAGARPHVDLVILKKSLAFGARLHPGNVAQFLNYRLDRFLVALFLTPTDVGLYATASLFSEAMWQIPHAIRVVLLQRVAAADDTVAANETTARVCRVIVALVGLMCIAMMVFGHFVILLLYGNEYLPATPALVILLPGTWALSVGKLLAIHLAGSGKPEVGTLGAIVSLVATLILDFALIPRLGIAGAAIASSIAYTLATLVIAISFLRTTAMRWTDIIILKRGDIRILHQAFTRFVSRNSAVAFLSKKA